ncbi:MAG TPA: cysteine hydrolase [Candidatus Limnocylindria bacterium]|nr:cysteine hydrolase [Candidatus Limnocylindria bacterium]
MTARWNPDPRLTSTRTGVVLFDVLQDYLHPHDAQKAAALRARALADRLAQLADGARAAGLRIFYACANHAADGSDVVPRLTDTDMELRPWDGAPKPFRPLLRHGEPGIAIARGLEPGEHDVVILKHRWSAFHQTALDLNLRARGIDTIVLAGLSTDVGIASTAFAARDADYAIVVARDACWSHRPGNHDFFMERVFPRMARVMSTAEAVALMERTPAA